ncbi:hypothetical protein P3G55_23645 [Leptospira sp. 96542]|nr:hypothetical protein [Leptospira sp. 96542]
MATVAENRAQWEKLHMDWVFANQEARKARSQVTAAFIACSDKSGSGPTLIDLEETEALERKADEARALADNFIKGMFG